MIGGQLQLSAAVAAVTCLFLIITLQQCSAQSVRVSNPCTKQNTCGSCIAASPECGWCSLEGFDKDSRDRCDLVQNLIDAECDISDIANPNHDETMTLDLEPKDAETGKDPIQLSPQKIDLKIRPNKPYTVDIRFRQAENYPVDLYYIMDLSNSMEDDQAMVAKLGDLLAEEMSKITKNFHLGFGSFIDKKTMPYVDITPSALMEPCKKCVPAYGFKNQLKLTDDTSLFKSYVIAANISGNLDSPEGGFDAMIQAIVCEDVGWRSRSRKLVVYSTDAGFHLAGDGLLAGIVKPNDGECHLDSSQYYSESLNQDYPSISQIANKVTENNVNVIFAVKADQVALYNKLKQFIVGSVVGELADDSSNIVALVKNNYERISSVVEMTEEAPEGVTVTWEAYCLDDNNQPLPVAASRKCENVGIGDEVRFRATIKVTDCPEDSLDWQQDLVIQPVGLAEELRISLEMICRCDCERPDVGIENSPLCNGTGTYQCGSCMCNPGKYGKKCECDDTNVDKSDNDALCRIPGSPNTTEPCSERGQCVCGICECNPVQIVETIEKSSGKYSGKYCECNDYNCDIDDDKLCGGHGTCKCSLCLCEPGYNGSACECPTSDEPCRSEENGKICSGQGTCKCGKCTCRDTYRGPKCGDCPTCVGKCEENKQCVLCTAFESGTYTKEDCESNCSHVSIAETIEENDDWKICKFRDDKDNCVYYFSYNYNSDLVEVQEEKECPSILVMGMALGFIILFIVLLGILLLIIWKVCVTIYDRREYARFEKEVEKAKWDMAENPIFKPATSTYTNPNKRD